MNAHGTVWPEVPLGEICEFKYGRSLPGPLRVAGDVPVYGSNGVVGAHNEAITTGPTIVVGRKGSFGEVAFSSSPCWPIDTTYYIDRTATKADLRWLAYRLSALGLTGLNRAAAIPGLNREDAYRQRLLLPSLLEQRRIAEVLDRAEALRARRRVALAQLDTLTQSIFLDMFGDPVANPKGWQTAPLQEIALRGSGGLKRGPFGGALKKEVFVSCGYKVFEQQHAIYKNYAAGRYFITEPKYRSMQGFAVQPGDFIVSCSGTVGRIFRLPPTAPKGVINEALLRIRIDESQVTPTFFEALFESVGFQRGLLGGAHGTGIDNFPPMGQMRATKTVVPPLAVQHEFVRRVAVVEQLKAAHRASLTQMEALFASLQHRAFQGEL